VGVMDFDDAMIIGATRIIYNGNLKLVAVYKLSYIYIYIYIYVLLESVLKSGILLKAATGNPSIYLFASEWQSAIL